VEQFKAAVHACLRRTFTTQLLLLAQARPKMSYIRLVMLLMFFSLVQI